MRYNCIDSCNFYHWKHAKNNKLWQDILKTAERQLQSFHSKRTRARRFCIAPQLYTRFNKKLFQRLPVSVGWIWRFFMHSFTVSQTDFNQELGLVIRSISLDFCLTLVNHASKSHLLDNLILWCRWFTLFLARFPLLCPDVLGRTSVFIWLPSQLRGFNFTLFSRGKSLEFTIRCLLKVSRH